MRESGTPEPLNMIVPIDILKPILDDLLTMGRPNRPPRPWLGLYATEIDDKVVVARVVRRRPGASAPTCAPATSCWRSPADEVSDLAGFFRKVWSLGKAGVEVPLTIYRDGRTLRGARHLRRPQPLPQGAEPALNKRTDHRSTQVSRGS